MPPSPVPQGWWGEVGAVLIDGGLELLDQAECLRLLASQHVGRVGVSVGSLPAIFPVNYAVDGDQVLFRTGEGTKLAVAVSGAVVAFETDWFDSFSHEGWSVLVVGRAEVVPEGDDKARVRAWAPGERDRLVSIRAELVSGRRIRHDVDEQR
ncbi:MAG TPA: pyridoxamine 5'-phosphate oxidase family protein [Acidimicrobiales bacterium]|nr:pyridoxamine 5'-phosphate oxidase family protein [Acidimicrobiales bacterium]